MTILLNVPKLFFDTVVITVEIPKFKTSEQYYCKFLLLIVKIIVRCYQKSYNMRLLTFQVPEQRGARLIFYSNGEGGGGQDLDLFQPLRAMHQNLFDFLKFIWIFKILLESLGICWILLDSFEIFWNLLEFMNSFKIFRILLNSCIIFWILRVP